MLWERLVVGAEVRGIAGLSDRQVGGIRVERKAVGVQRVRRRHRKGRRKDVGKGVGRAGGGQAAVRGREVVWRIRFDRQPQVKEQTRAFQRWDLVGLEVLSHEWVQWALWDSVLPGEVVRNPPCLERGAPRVHHHVLPLGLLGWVADGAQG